MTQHWNPEIPDQRVRQKNCPGRQGKTTGKVQLSEKQSQVEVQFQLNHTDFVHVDELEICPKKEEIRDLITKKSFGYPVNLRQVLTFEKLQKKLLNPFYDQQYGTYSTLRKSSKLQFKVADLNIGRFLISNNTTVERELAAFYVLKQLQTQDKICRVLIVTPSQVKKQWRENFSKLLYGIANNTKEENNSKEKNKEKKKADSLSQIYELNSARELISNNQKLKPYFTFTSDKASPLSIEILGLGKIPKNWQDEKDESEMAQLAKFLSVNIATPISSLFDLVIIDRAEDYAKEDSFYHQLGELLRQNTKHLLLLLNQPIEVNDSGFRQLLRLFDNSLSPSSLFSELLTKPAEVSLLVFSDAALSEIHQPIQTSSESVRELMKFVEDFLEEYCRQYQFKDVSEALIEINLPPVVRNKIRSFVNTTNPALSRFNQEGTALYFTPILSLFDPRIIPEMKRGYELLEPNHPLIQWIQKQYECREPSLHRVSACELHQDAEKLPSGMYFYAVLYRQEVEPQRQHQFIYRLVEVSQDKPLSEEQAKEVITQAALDGSFLPNVAGQAQTGQIDYEKVQSILERQQQLIRTETDQDRASFAKSRLKVAKMQQQKIQDRVKYQLQEIEQKNQKWLERQRKLTEIVSGVQAKSFELLNLESALKRLGTAQQADIEQKAAQVCAEIKGQAETSAPEQTLIAAGLISVIN